MQSKPESESREEAKEAKQGRGGTGADLGHQMMRQKVFPLFARRLAFPSPSFRLRLAGRRRRLAIVARAPDGGMFES